MIKEMNWMRTNYFAHRGLHDKTHPENTMAAFQRAVQKGFDIELDVTYTKDNQIVVFHDNNLKRLCRVEGNIQDKTFDEIKSLPILQTGETIPLLSDVLQTLPQETYYLIELKSVTRYKSFVQSFIKLIDEFPITYAIHSFDPRIVYQFKKQSPHIIRGQISSSFPEKKGFLYKLSKHLFYNLFTKPDFVNYRFEDLPRKQLDRLKQKGMMILSYTAKNQKGLDFVRKRYDNAVFEGFIPTKK
jgi:glycerophosphoryl diester phosphodiesterase